MSYEKETVFIDLGSIFIKKQEDGSVKRFASVKIGNKSLIANLRDSSKRFEGLVKSGHMTQQDADEKLAKDSKNGRKYEIQLVVEQ